jgi:integrase
MAKGEFILTARGVAALSKPGRHSDGNRLYLAISKTGRKTWSFFYKRNGVQREMGLGSLDEVTLAEAREKAADARKLLSRGQDPLDAKRAAKPSAPTFGKAAADLVASLEPSFKSAVHRAQWRTTLGIDPYVTDRVRIDRQLHEAHVTALTALREKRVDEVATTDVLAVLSPLWQVAPETASRLRGRIERVLDAAKAKGAIPSPWENPARWRGHLDHLLSKPSKRDRGHHAALPYDEVAAFVARLRKVEGVSARALEFAILTAARSGEVLGATWGEIDLDAKLWTVPGSRMKSGKTHRVPLSAAAIAILTEIAFLRRDPSNPAEPVFPGRVRGKGLSPMALEMIVRRLGVEATPHGFRSAFRDWCGDETSFPREVAEAALAHAIGDKTELAYRRSDALAKRRDLMEAWARYVEPQAAGNVVSLNRAG